MLTRSLRFAAIALMLMTMVDVGIGSFASAQGGERLKVVATFSILGDIVQNVAGDNIDLTVIVGPDGDAHTFEPKPNQIAALADADMIFENGIGFETWLDDMYSASGSKATRVVVTAGLPVLEFGGQDEGELAHEDEATHTEDDGHDHGKHDPHVWNDVQNVIAEVTTIRHALIAADPANTDSYIANATAYTEQLQDLDASLTQMVKTVPADKLIIVTSHDALAYFAHAYGFTIAGTALGSMSTEASDPSAGDIAKLIEQIKSIGVPAIFVENAESSNLMDQIARDAGVTLAPRLYTDALSKSDGLASTYVALMTYNATTIVTALGGSVT